MSIKVLEHPAVDTLAAFNRGTLPLAERAAIEGHIAQCNSCLTALAGLSDDRLVGLARQAAAQPATQQMVDVPDVPAELVDHPRYRIVKQLGAGGMGVVFKAEDLVMGRTVALKVIGRRYTANPAAVERFRREVRAAARLNNPNIVTAHDAGEANGLHFLVMEHVEGISLDRLVQKKGPLPLATACQCIRQAALGLQHAFEQKMVHRDIKPHNLMVTRKGQVKVLDLGLARIAAEAEPAPFAGGTDLPERTVTTPSLVMGTPDYLAPEQARNAHAVDIRADIYALGCVFYYLLTGRAPFAKLGTAIEKMLAHVEDDPTPIREVRPDVSPELATIINKMLAKKVDDRFATPAEVAALLKPFARGEVVVDEQPDVLDPPAATAPTDPLADLRTDVVHRARPKRRQARPRRHNYLPVLIAAGVATVVILGVGLFAAFGGFSKDRDSRPGDLPSGSGAGILPGDVGVAVNDGKPVLFVVPNQGLHSRDYWPVVDRLRAAKVDVVTASTRLQTCQFDFQGGNRPVTPTQLVERINTADYSAVIFCGNNVTEYLTGPGSSAAQRIIIDMSQQGKIIAAICTGQRVLVVHGPINGKQVAAPDQQFLPEEHLRKVGAVPVRDRRVITDGKLITAAGPDYAVPFAESILAALAK